MAAVVAALAPRGAIQDAQVGVTMPPPHSVVTDLETAYPILKTFRRQGTPEFTKTVGVPQGSHEVPLDTVVATNLISDFTAIMDATTDWTRVGALGANIALDPKEGAPETYVLVFQGFLWLR
jgi:hypothetical protein